MRVMSIKHVCLAAVLLWSCTSLWAQSGGKDVAGASDHPLVKRYTGSWLAGYRQRDWDAVLLPTTAQLGTQDELKAPRTLEGRITQLLYIAPRGRSPLEVYRNHERALAAAGLVRSFACEADCNELYLAWSKQAEPTEALRWADGEVAAPDGSAFGLSSALGLYGRMLAGTLQQGGRDVHVLLYTSPAADKSTGQAATYLQIVEPKAMTGGQVAVDLKALQAGLKTDGKVTLHGLFFDTGKATLQSASKPQLDEMANLLRNQPALRVFIVGHTDNVGSFDANQALSLARAQAVVTLLVAPPYRIAAERLLAKGAANIAPQAANGDETGRARNRRVELVAQ
jgi:OmpA-OmpF porin, OOP family